jgi:hypothetical protein
MLESFVTKRRDRKSANAKSTDLRSYIGEPTSCNPTVRRWRIISECRQEAEAAGWLNNRAEFPPVSDDRGDEPYATVPQHARSLRRFIAVQPPPSTTIFNQGAPFYWQRTISSNRAAAFSLSGANCSA